MVDSNYILDSLKSLDNYSTTIESLSDKLCTKICNDYGINRTTELEEKVNKILSRYRYGLVSDNDVVSNIDSIVKESASNTENTNSNTVNNTSESSKASPENTSNNTNNIPNEVNTDDKTNTETIEDTNTNTEKDKKNNESQETIKDDSNSNIQKNVPKTIAGAGSIINSELDDSDDMVDVVTDAVMDSASQYSDVESSLSGAEITVPSIVSGDCGALVTAAENAKTLINDALNEVKTALTSIINAVSNLDEGISPVEDSEYLSFSDIASLAYDIRMNSKAVEATEDFYRNGGCDIVDEIIGSNGRPIKGKFAVIEVDGKECQYDLKNKKFYVNGNYAYSASIYLPSENNDYSHLNTYTYFLENTDKFLNHVTSGNDGQGGKGQSTNAILIQVTKPKSWDDSMNSNTAYLTKFINKTANVSEDDLKNRRCKNIIGGDSVYGTYSLKIAANNGDFYDTVYCIDNAAIITGYNNHGGDKAQLTENEARNLRGKDIYFISVSGDPNIDHGQKYYAFNSKGGSYNLSYNYTGIKQLCEWFEGDENTKLHMVYSYDAVDENGKPMAHNDLMQVYRDLDEQYSVFSYDETWFDFVNGRYFAHSQGNYVTAEAVKAPVTNANYYYHE